MGEKKETSDILDLKVNINENKDGLINDSNIKNWFKLFYVEN